MINTRYKYIIHLLNSITYKLAYLVDYILFERQDIGFYVFFFIVIKIHLIIIITAIF